MAHHNRTDPRVLNAPEPIDVVISPQQGLTRSERRHGFQLMGTTPEQLSVSRTVFGIAKAAGKNVPFVGKVFAVRAAELARRKARRTTTTPKEITNA